MEQKSNIWYFEDVDLYSIFCPHKIAGMKDTHSFEKFQKNDYVFKAGESDTNVYLISDGRVKIGRYNEEGEEVVKAILSRGELFGEMNITGERDSSEFAKALDNPTVICPLTVDDLKMLMRDNEELNFAIIKIIGLKLRKFERKVESMVFKDSRTRIIEFLLEMGEEKGKKVGFEMMIKNHYTHKDISRLTGTSRQTVTTTFNELRDQNLISFDRRRILIRDMEALREEAASGVE
ncbi:MAG: Crp/Fnr family transcriptional regulator [Bacteroidota bacterium]